MAPFGPENQKPAFEAKNVYVSNALSNFKERHVKFTASQEGNGSSFQVVGFDLGEHYEQLAMQTPFRMVFTIEENFYNGFTSIQLRAKDIKFD